MFTCSPSEALSSNNPHHRHSFFAPDLYNLQHSFIELSLRYHYPLSPNLYNHQLSFIELSPCQSLPSIPRSSFEENSQPTMDSSQSRLLRLPQELKDRIYHYYFDSVPGPGLLCVNKSLHYDSVHFVRKRLQTFTYNITAQYAGLDDFSNWCFKIKGHSPRLGRMKHLVLNVYPPNPDRPHENCHIWDHM